MENGIFSWGDEETVLKDINLRVEKGQLAAVVGTVGSGELRIFSRKHYWLVNVYPLLRQELFTLGAAR